MEKAQNGKLQRDNYNVTEEKLSKNDKAEKVDEALYRSLVECLILYVVSPLSRFNNCATDTHFRADKKGYKIC